MIASGIQRAIGEAAGLENLAVNRYEVNPGESIPLAYHFHDEQEEMFYILKGTLHVETPEGEYTIASDEVFIVEPDNPQRAFNPEEAEGKLKVLVVGAPPTDDVHAYNP